MHCQLLLHLPLLECFIQELNDIWILQQTLFSYLETYPRPPIFLEDNTPVEVSGDETIDLEHGSIHHVLCAPQLSVNLISIYQITHTWSGKKVEFTLDIVVISNMTDGFRVAIVELNHYSKLYNFSHFIPKSDFSLLTHLNEERRLWHERFGHCNYKYLDQLSKKGMVERLPNIQYTYGVFQGCMLGKHSKEKLKTRKDRTQESYLTALASAQWQYWTFSSPIYKEGKVCVNIH